MAQNTNNQNFVPKVPAPNTAVVPQLQTLSNTPTTVATQYTNTMPIIQNTNQIPYAQNVVYNQQQNQQQQPTVYTQVQQPYVQNSNNLLETVAQRYITNLENRAQQQASAKTTTPQLSSALNRVNQQIITNAEKKISDIYQGERKAEEERQKEFERLKEENEKFRKEKDEVNKNQEIDDKIEERYGSEMEEKDIEIAKLQDEIADIQGAKEMLEQQIDELGGISMKDILLEEEESRKKHLEQLKEIAHKHNDALSSETNKLTNLEGELNKKQESIGIIKKILMFFGGSEPKDITELREKIEKAREQMKDLQQNVSDSNKELRENEKEYLKFINRKITTINNLHKNQRNEVEQRDKMMQEIKNSKENQDEIKQMLKNRNGLNNMRNTNYINRLRMDEQAKEDMYEKIKASKMYDKKQKDIYSNRAKYGTKSARRDNSIGRN